MIPLEDSPKDEEWNPTEDDWKELEQLALHQFDEEIPIE